MSNLEVYPQAKTADICILLEGTYPFLPGGVSNWVYELIRAFPEYTFAAIFLGTRAEDYKGLVYPLPSNVVHFQPYYLFEATPITAHKNKHIDKKSMQCVRSMHDKFHNIMTPEEEPITEIYQLLLEPHCPVDENFFLRSRASWELLLEKYRQHHADESFFDYFWGVRNLHRPFWKLASIVEELPTCKLLHSASTGYAGFLGALLQKKYQLPYVLTEHGIYTKERWIDLMRNYFFEEAVKEGRSFDMQQGLLAIWMRFFSILGKLSYDAANPVISLFEGYRQRQIQDGAREDRTKIISYGIDFNRYAFLNKPGPSKTNPVIACIGRVVPIKDIKTFIRACAVVIQEKPETEAWIIGSMKEDQEYVTTCQSLIKILGLEDKIKLLGSQDVMEIYPKIDLLLLSSISEGSPFVMLESMAVGIPVIATDVGGCSELIYGKSEADQALGLAGRLVNMADPRSLAEATLELLNNKEAWCAAQKAGLARVRAYYGMQRLIQEYGDIYKDAIDHGGYRI